MAGCNENAVYLCGWKQGGSGFVLWVKARPALRGEGANYPEAEERLIAAIHDAGGAMQAVLEYDRPLPKSSLDAKYSRPELYLIGGDDQFQTDSPLQTAFETPEEREARFGWLDAFFQAPVCRECRSATSARSEKLLTLSHAPRYDGGFGHAGHGGAPTLQVLSEEFLNLLTDEERGALQLRPVNRLGRGRKRFYELIGPGGAAPAAAAGLAYSGWRCVACDYRVWSYWIPGMAITEFIAASDIPETPVGVFTVGMVPEVKLVATAERWRELVGRTGTRGFVSRPLGVVPDRELMREPALPVREEQLIKPHSSSGR